MRTGRPKVALVITVEERAELVRLSRRARINRNVAFRAKLVLACAETSSNSEVGRLDEDLPGKPSSAALTRASPSCAQPFLPTWTPTTRRASPSSGARQQT